MENNLTSAPEVALPISKPKMAWWKKTIIFLVVVALVGGLTLFKLPLLLTYMYPGDADPVDDSNLALAAVSVPDAENGFFDLEKLNNIELIIPTIDGKPMDLEYTDHTKPINWDQSLVEKLLADNQEALELFNSAANKKYIQVPEYSDPSKVNAETNLPKINKWRSVPRLQAIKAVSLSYQNKQDEALLAALQINKFANKVIDANNSLINALVGEVVYRLGSQTILRILPYNSPSPEILDEVKMVLINHNNLDGYRNALKMEYINVVNNLRTINGQSELLMGDINPKVNNYSKYGYYYKPIQTKNLFTSLYNSQVSQIGQECNLHTVDQNLESYARTFSLRAETWRLVITENALGKTFYSVTAVSLGSFINKICQNELLKGVAEVELALLQYKKENGSLPKTLTELIPKFLASIPEDPYDHKPIKYSPTKKILYSVGRSKADLSGSMGNNWLEMENPTFSIGF